MLIEGENERAISRKFKNNLIIKRMFDEENSWIIAISAVL